MAGVRDELILDISNAQRSIDALERQITQAVSGISIEVNTAGISQEITQSVQAADTSVTVTAATSGISQEISREVERADTHVDVDADTSDARRQVQLLRTDLDKTGESGNRLRQVLTGAAILAGVRGLFSLAQAASAVSEQVTGSEIVFGAFARDVQRFADQADRIGLSEVQALQLSNTFGQLAMSAGLAADEVEEFATRIVTRGADIASLRDIDLTETLNALRAGLVGETEPLRNIGIFINEATVATRAYELGLAALGDELTDQQKIQARYSLILEQSEIAAGNFALTADGLANKQRQVKAALQDLAADSGRLLEPTFLRLATLAERDLIPALSELAEEALPPLGQVLEALAPILGVSLDLLIALAPALGVIADVAGAIPPEVLAIGGSALIANKAFGGLLSTTSGLGGALRLFPSLLAGTAQALPNATAGVGSLAGGVTGLGTKLGNLNPLVAAAGLGLVTFLAVTAEAAEKKRLFRIEVDEATEALKSEDGQVRLTTAGLAEYVQQSSRFETKNQIDDLSRLGLEFVNVASLAGDGADGLRTFLDTAVRRGEVIEVFRNELGNLVDAQGKQIQVGDAAAAALQRTTEINGRLFTGNTDLIKSFTELQAVTSETAKAQVEAAVAAGQASDAQVEAAIRASTGAAGVIDYVAALDRLQRAFDAQELSTERTIARYESLANQFIDTSAAAGLLNDEVPQVASAIRALRIGTTEGERGMVDLAIAADRAALSEEQMAAAAKLLGTDVDSLAGFIESTSEALNDFVDNAIGGLPTVSGILQQVQADAQAAEDQLASEQERTSRDVQATVRQFAAGLRDSAEELADFREDLARITSAGFTDVAGLLAEQGFDAGNAYADELVAAIENGNTDLLVTLQEANNTFKAESLTTVAFLRDELGPQLLSATGLIATAISSNFGENLTFEDQMRIAGGLAKTELDVQGQQIATIAAVEGEAAAREYGAALKLDQAVIDAGVAAGVALQTAVPPGDVTRAGEDVGFAFIDGAVAAFENDRRLEASAVAAVLKAVAKVRESLGIFSPSRVAMELGDYFIEGLAVGIDRSSSAVQASVRASSRVVDALGSQVPQFGLRTAASGAPGSGTQIDYDRLARAITSALPTSSGDSVQLVVQGASVDGAHATATEAMRQLHAERYRQTGFAG